MAFEGLTEKLQGALRKLSSKGKLTEENVKEGMREVRMALLEADVNYAVAKDFIKKVTARCVGTEITGTLSASQQVIKIVNEEMTQLMGGENARLTWSSGPLTVYMLCGLQGNGKTTHAAKLAKYFIKQGRRPMLVACDIYRPAAIDQLQVVGKQAGAPVFTLPGEKPPAIAKKALAHAKDYGNDIIILDTAGRLHNKQNLMNELNKISRILDRELPGASKEVLLVLDGTTGQNGLIQAKQFLDTADLTGIVLTKLDGTAKGGIVFAIANDLQLPVKYVGVGEQIDDLLEFKPAEFVEALLS